MRAYRAILSAQVRTLLQYRAAAFAGLCTQLFFGFVMVMVYEAFYRSTTADMPTVTLLRVCRSGESLRESHRPRSRLCHGVLGSCHV